MNRRSTARARSLATQPWRAHRRPYFVIDEHLLSLYQRIAAALKPRGLVIVQGVGSGGTLEALPQAWSKWEPSKLRLLQKRE